MSLAIQISNLAGRVATEFNNIRDELGLVTQQARRYGGVNAQTGTSYTPLLTDEGKLVTLSNAAAITVTLPQNSALAFPVGGRVDFVWLGVGAVTFAQGTGATVNGTPGLKLRARYSAASAVKIATNQWLLVGDLSA